MNATATTVIAVIVALVFAQLVLLPVLFWLQEGRKVSFATIWRDGQLWLPSRY